MKVLIRWAISYIRWTEVRSVVAIYMSIGGVTRLSWRSDEAAYYPSVRPSVQPAAWSVYRDSPSVSPSNDDCCIRRSWVPTRRSTGTRSHATRRRCNVVVNVVLASRRGPHHPVADQRSTRALSIVSSHPGCLVDPGNDITVARYKASKCYHGDVFAFFFFCVVASSVFEATITMVSYGPNTARPPALRSVVVLNWLVRHRLPAIGAVAVAAAASAVDGRILVRWRCGVRVKATARP